MAILTRWLVAVDSLKRMFFSLLFKMGLPERMAEAGIRTYGRLWVREGRGAVILKVIIMIATFFGVY